MPNQGSSISLSNNERNTHTRTLSLPLQKLKLRIDWESNIQPHHHPSSHNEEGQKKT